MHGSHRNNERIDWTGTLVSSEVCTSNAALELTSKIKVSS